MNLKCLFGHKWIMAERPSKPGDFKEGWSPMYFYEMCTRCGKQKNTLDALTLKGMNSRFQREMNRIQRIRNTRNKKCRNEWDTCYRQEIAKLK